MKKTPVYLCGYPTPEREEYQFAGWYLMTDEGENRGKGELEVVFLCGKIYNNTNGMDNARKEESRWKNRKNRKTRYSRKHRKSQ